MLPTIDHISNFIKNQFPSFYKEEGQTFISFVEEYYKWLEQTNNSNDKGRNLFNTRDIDTTADAFVEQFKAKYMYAIPKEIAGNKKFLQKHILDLYRSKGSVEGLKLFFRLLYNEEVQLYIPSEDIIKPSDGKWVEKKYIEATYTPFNGNFENKLITGSSSGATAYVEAYNRIYTGTRIINVFYLSDIRGTFVVDEKIAYDGLDFVDAPRILGSPVSVSVVTSSVDNEQGDILLASNGSGLELKLIISDVRVAGSANGTIAFTIDNGGSGYTLNPNISITPGTNTTGTGATFTGIILSNTSTFNYSTSYIYYAPYYPVTEAFNSNSGVNSTSDFITTSNTNTLANNDYVLYYTAAGNTALTGLTNNTSYWVVSANSTGLKLASTRGGANINITASVTESGHYLYKDAVVRFDGNTSVSNTNMFITIANNNFANGDYVKYFVEAGNTAIGGLSNNTGYFIVGANSTGVKLASGNSVTYNTTPISITSTVTEYGHTLKAYPVSNLALNAVTYGPHLNNASQSTVLNQALSSANATIGTISQLTGINPGDGYNGNILVSIEEPIIKGYNLDDGAGGIQGLNGVITTTVELGSGLVSNVRVKNSGIGYHTKYENILFYNSTQGNTQQTITGNVTLGAVGTQEGYWETTRGFLDSNKYIQDSYYYQEYSYEVKFSKSLDKYSDILKQLVHPAGNELFGKALLLNQSTGEEVAIDNDFSIYRILGAALAPATPGEDTFTLNVSRLV